MFDKECNKHTLESAPLFCLALYLEGVANSLKNARLCSGVQGSRHRLRSHAGVCLALLPRTLSRGCRKQSLLPISFASHIITSRTCAKDSLSRHRLRWLNHTCLCPISRHWLFTAPTQPRPQSQPWCAQLECTGTGRMVRRRSAPFRQNLGH